MSNVGTMSEHPDVLWWLLGLVISVAIWGGKRELGQINTKLTQIGKCLWGDETTTGLLGRVETIEHECDRRLPGRKGRRADDAADE